MAVDIAGHQIKTPYLWGGAVVAILVGYAIVKSKRNAAAAAAAATTSSATQIDPATGDIAGSPQDLADLAAQQGGDTGTPDYGAYGGYAGGASAYYPDTIASSGPQAVDPNTGVPYAEETGWVYNSQSGTWSYTGTAGAGAATTGSGTFTTNAQWLQASESYFVSNNLVSDGGVALTSALGKYLAASDVTPDQETLIQQATGLEGYPPVSGPAGYPPGIHLSSSQTTPPPSSTTPPAGSAAKVKVPNVVGWEQADAFEELSTAGLHASGPPAVPGKVHTVTKQSPAAGTSVAAGSTVQLTSKLS